MRKARGWTQGHLAARASVGARTVQKAENGQPVKLETIELLADALNVEPDELLCHHSVDAMKIGPWALSKYFSNPFQPHKKAFAESPDEIVEGITLMMQTIDLVRQETGMQANGLKNSVRKVWMSLDTNDICQRYVDLWKTDPRTVMFAVKKGERVGISTVLPLKDETASQFLKGRLSLFEISGNDLIPSSQSIFLDSSFEYPDQEKRWLQITNAVFSILLWQLSSLSDEPLKPNYRLFSCAAKPDIVSRLEANGFHSTGVNTKDHGFPIYIADRISGSKFAVTRQYMFNALIAGYKLLATEGDNHRGSVTDNAD